MTDYARVFDGAADDIGHAKHALVDRRGGACVLGAVGLVMGAVSRKNEHGHYWYERTSSLEWSRSVKILASHHDAAKTEYDLVVWNNNPDTSGDDVIDLLRRAAKAEREATQ